MVRHYIHGLCCCLWLAPVTAALAQAQAPSKVTVATVELRDIPASMTLVGTLEPVRRSLVGAEIAGLVADMPVRQGDFVQAGVLICKLKDDTLELRRAEAYERLKALQASHRKWVFEVERMQRLYGDQDAAEKEVHDAQVAFDETAHAVGEQQGVILQLENDLEKTKIRAPFAGFIVTRHTEVGQWLVQGGNVVEMVELATVLVRVDVPEQALPYLHVGDEASVMVEALAQRFVGHIRHVILQADETARTFPVEIEVPNPGAGRVNTKPPSPDTTSQQPDVLAGGMFARVTLRTGPVAKAPAAPKDAVVTRAGVDYVAMVAPGQQAGALMAIPMPVTTGVDIGDWIAITSGNLAPGMQVVTKGNENIMFPTPIMIAEPDDPTAGAAAAATPDAPPASQVGS